MNDSDYRAARARLAECKKFIAENEDRVLDEAVRRDEAYVLHAWFHFSRQAWPYLTLGEAVERAQDDCSPDWIVGPGGKRYDPFPGEEQDRG